MLRVDAVIVPLFETGFAFAHTDSGECVRFTGPRDAMIALCNRVKSSTAEGRTQVFVDPAEWHDVTVIRDADDCWVHPFVEAPRPAA